MRRASLRSRGRGRRADSADDPDFAPGSPGPPRSGTPRWQATRRAAVALRAVVRSGASRRPIARALLAGLLDVVVLGASTPRSCTSRCGSVELPLPADPALPPVPLAAVPAAAQRRLLTMFTAAGGQTIGKMLAGIKVVRPRRPEDLERAAASVSARRVSAARDGLSGRRCCRRGWVSRRFSSARMDARCTIASPRRAS